MPPDFLCTLIDGPSGPAVACSRPRPPRRIRTTHHVSPVSTIASPRPYGADEPEPHDLAGSMALVPDARFAHGVAVELGAGELRVVTPSELAERRKERLSSLERAREQSLDGPSARIRRSSR